MKMKMSFLKLAFQHLAHPANAFERCLVFYFVKYYHYYYFEPDSCTVTATLATRIPRKKTSSQTKTKNLLLYPLVYLTTWSTLLCLCLFTRYTELGSIYSTEIARLLVLSATLRLTYSILSKKNTCL
ncbi:hypothetical protein BD560DRAFT_42216 [Blakeslea trispora]|nr:hypothetical protein BD560DRAFT_42216 [Blakeslea trispora]